MLTISDTRARIAIVVPVYFDSSITAEVVRAILEETFAQHDLFCDRRHTLVVVDRATVAEQVLRDAGPDSPLHDYPVHVLAHNSGKTGAIRQGLARLLEQSDRPFLVTRDCDGDNIVDDLPRMTDFADRMAEAWPDRPLSVVGARPSLSRPMNWSRQQWEELTNRTFFALADYLLARSGQVQRKSWWNGRPLDLQSGYRLYSRQTAHLAVRSLTRLPDDRETYLMACEMLPYLEIVLDDGLFGQVQRLTQVEQPVSSYSSLDFAASYGALLAFVCRDRELSPELALAILDNQIDRSEAYFSHLRQELERCRRRLSPGADPIRLPPFV